MSIINAIWKLKGVVTVNSKNYDEVKKVVNAIDKFVKNKQAVLSKKQNVIFNQQKNELTRFEGVIQENAAKVDELFGFLRPPRKTATVTKLPEGGIDRVPVTQQFTGKSFTADDHIKFIKSKEPVESMKEANKVIKREGRYKNLSHEEADRILKDTEDHIFQRDVPEDFASGGRIGYGKGKIVGEIIKAGQGKFTKLEVLIQRLTNTIKTNKDPYVQKTFPNFIKELKANPELAKDPKVWKHLTEDLDESQRLIVYSDDTVDLFRQTKRGPHNIELTDKFMKENPFLTRETALDLLHMDPADRILE